MVSPVQPALPDSKAILEVQALLAGLDLSEQQVILDLLDIRVVPVSLDLPEPLEIPDIRVSVAAVLFC